MKITTIKIGRKTYKVKFSMRSNRILAKLYGFNNFGDVLELMNKLEFSEDHLTFTFDQEDFIARMIISGIEYAQPDEDIKLTVEQTIEAIYANIEATTAIMQTFTSALFKTLGKTTKAQPAQK